MTVMCEPPNDDSEEIIEALQPTPIEQTQQEIVIKELEKIDTKKINISKQIIINSEISKWNKENLEIAKKLGENRTEEKTKKPKEKENSKHKFELDSTPPKFAEPGSTLFEQLDKKMRPIPGTKLHKQMFPSLYEKEQKTEVTTPKSEKQLADEAVFESAKYLVKKMSEKTGATLEKREIEDAVYIAEVDKEKTAERDLPNGYIVKSEDKLPTNSEEICKRILESCEEGLETIIKRKSADVEKMREKKVGLQTAKHAIAEGKELPRNTTIPVSTEKLDITADVALLQTNANERSIDAKVDEQTIKQDVQEPKFSGAEITNYSFIMITKIIESIDEINKKQKNELIADLEKLLLRSLTAKERQKLHTITIPREIIALFSESVQVYYEDENAYKEHKPYVKLCDAAITKKVEEIKAKFAISTGQKENLEKIIKKESEKVERPAEKKEEEKLEQDARTGKIMSGSYKIVGKIGEGSFGILYAAEAEITGKKVVLKTSNDEDFDKGNDHILAEAIVHKLLNHPNIVSIDAVFYDYEKRVYAMMPKIKGVKKLDVSQKRNLKGIAQIAKILADTYNYAHKKGVLHRDIKPDNILLDSENKPYVIDFGVAKVTDKDEIDKLRNTVGETSFTNSKKAGTQKYMAPEILEGDAQPSPTTDVYSLGKILYHMLMQTDKATPIGDVKKQLMQKTDELRSLQNLNYIARDKLCEIVAKAVSDVDNRYKSMQEFADDLETVIGDLPDKIVNEVKPTKEEQKILEEKVEEKTNSKTADIILNINYRTFRFGTYRGHGLSHEEQIMKAAEHISYINNILTAFGSTINIYNISFILKKNVPFGTQNQLATKLRDVFEKYEEYEFSCYEQVKEIKYCTIDFSSKDEKIKGSVSFEHNTVYVTIIPHKITQSDTNLLKALAYFVHQNKGYTGLKAIWGSPKEKLEKKGFTLEYAIDLFDNNKFRSSEIKFEEGKPLHNVNGKCLGYACTFGEYLPRDIVFKRGLLGFKTSYEPPTYNLIDLGDNYLLKP